jgi:hypothetical protein
VDVFLPASVATLHAAIDALPDYAEIFDPYECSFESGGSSEYDVASDGDMRPLPMASRADIEACTRASKWWRRAPPGLLEQLEGLGSPPLLAPRYAVRAVEYARLVFDTVDGERELTINFVFTNVPDARAPHAITDGFDLTCCAVALRADGGTLRFEVRDDAVDAILGGRLQLTSGAFRRAQGSSGSAAARKQLKRVRKYYRRGFRWSYERAA